MKIQKILMGFAILLGTFSVGAARAVQPIVRDDSPKIFGLGVLFGEPTGVSAKYWTDGRQAFDAALSYSFDNFFQVHADYLFHFPSAFTQFDMSGHRLVPYLGAGAALAFGNRSNYDKRFLGRDSSFGFGARVPFGLEFLFTGHHLGAFLEIVPGLRFAPSTTVFVQGGVGIRYYF